MSLRFAVSPTTLVDLSHIDWRISRPSAGSYVACAECAPIWLPMFSLQETPARCAFQTHMDLRVPNPYGCVHCSAQGSFVPLNNRSTTVNTSKPVPESEIRAGMKSVQCTTTLGSSFNLISSRKISHDPHAPRCHHTQNDHHHSRPPPSPPIVPLPVSPTQFPRSLPRPFLPIQTPIPAPENGDRRPEIITHQLVDLVHKFIVARKNETFALAYRLVVVREGVPYQAGVVILWLGEISICTVHVKTQGLVKPNLVVACSCTMSPRCGSKTLRVVANYK